jgi:Cys-tRNA(Pro)/Cys-tRNA(Cys) deacylase
MKTKNEKTNVMRFLDAKKAEYESYFYDNLTLTSEELTSSIGIDIDAMFKTLVCEGKSGQNYVFMVRVNGELDLKKAASVTGEKSISLIPQKMLLPLTGYVHGGCSPIGMKKQFPTFIDEMSDSKDWIAFSGGRIGCQVKLRPETLHNVFNIIVADIVSL